MLFVKGVAAFYPPKVNELFADARHAGKAAGANAVGTAASFDCGSLVRVSLRIDAETKVIMNAGFQTTGCGYMIASAEAVCRLVEGKRLTDLHGEVKDELADDILQRLGDIPTARELCLSSCLDALAGAFADFRSYLIEEFTGEKALVCTCFGVSEETIEQQVAQHRLTTVEQVGQATNAGRGCGSCQMLIREILDSLNRS